MTYSCAHINTYLKAPLNTPPKRFLSALCLVQLLAFCLTLTLIPAANAVPHPNERLENPALEARALALTDNLRCVVCQNETISHSSADMARDMRLLVRTQIMEGKTDAEITEFLTARYGDFILMTPPFSPRTYVLWFMPLLAIMGGVLLLLPTFFHRKARRKAKAKALENAIKSPSAPNQS